ncbi:uncharacterized protein LOC113775946 [Coffea eugenioides]|uniref:uncharacterized protein LOC113775946 n=1 Tax=Coffea eugenioides TaxID=49369 RepID=UPI000F60A1C0|nr:uncharacterized protein LOC113775946 [Coffea eugenioides]
MEKPLQKLLIQHFSHEHLLERRLFPPEGNCICFGCKLQILPGKHGYRCRKCPFYLHQVCYSMPQKIQHPVDPNHHLTLLAMPSDFDKAIDCKACEQTIAGFYYNCATCGTFYHMLCLATPLSVKLPVHPHTLKLEFSPPYKFQCDLCDMPSHRGWLYRCGFCEFDVHISCAIMDSQAMLQLQPQTRVLEIDGRTDADSKRHELMALVLKGIAGLQGQENFPSQSEYYQPSPLSEYAPTPSFQLSEACFSIDIERSFIHDGLESKEADFHLVQLQESKETKKIGYVVLTKGDVHDPKQPNPVVTPAKNPSDGSRIGTPQKGQKPANSSAISSHVWVELGQENAKANASNDNAGLVHQTQEQGRWCSCW